MIRTQHDGSVELFKQENPASDEEAFISSGRPYFSGILVAKAIKAAEAAPEPVLGTLVATDWVEKRTRGGRIMVPTGAKWVPAEEAQRGWPWSLVPGAERSVEVEAPLLEVWEHPVTAESQEGLPAGSASLRARTWRRWIVAEGEADTFEVGDFHAIRCGITARTCRWRSTSRGSTVTCWRCGRCWSACTSTTALLAIEVNSVGMAVQDPVKNDYKYRRLYRRRRYDAARNVVSDKPGWKTSPETKPLIEDAFGQLLQSDVRGGLRSVRAARQLTVYVMDERGRRGAMPGENDDLLMASMIAARIMEEMRPPNDKGARKVRGHRVEDPLTGY
jgi:ferredoxin